MIGGKNKMAKRITKFKKKKEKEVKEMTLPTKKGTIKWKDNKKFIAKSSRKTGKNTYTTVWQELPKKKSRR